VTDKLARVQNGGVILDRFQHDGGEVESPPQPFGPILRTHRPLHHSAALIGATKPAAFTSLVPAQQKTSDNIEGAGMLTIPGSRLRVGQNFGKEDLERIRRQRRERLEFIYRGVADLAARRYADQDYRPPICRNFRRPGLPEQPSTNCCTEKRDSW